MNKLWGCIAIATVALMVPAGVHAADIVLPLDTVVASGVAETEEFELALVSSNGLDGEICVVRAVHGGNGPAHPGNNLVVTSGASITLEDVEREPGAVTDGASSIVLANTIRVVLEMGPDQHYAGDVDLEFDCGDQVAAFRAAPERSTDGGSGRLPLTGTQVTFALAIGAGLIVTAVALMMIARRRPSPPGPSHAS